MSTSIRSLCEKIVKVSAKAYIDTLPLSALAAVPVVGPIAGALAPIAGPIAKPILKELVNVAFEQMSHQTSKIDQKLDQLIKVHYKVGIDSLRDAALVDERMRELRLLDALRQFNEAANLEIEVVRQARSMFFVGVCYTLLGQHPAALRWYEDAYQKGQEHLAVLLQRVEAEAAGHDRAFSFKDVASKVDDLTDDPTAYGILMMAARSMLKAGPYGAALGLLVMGAGYATKGAIMGGKAVANWIEASQAGHLSQRQQELLSFGEHFLKPLEQVLRSGQSSVVKLDTSHINALLRDGKMWGD